MTCCTGCHGSGAWHEWQPGDDMDDMVDIWTAERDYLDKDKSFVGRSET